MTNAMHIVDHSFTSVVLAGGKSSRMGVDKRFLIWDKRPLWDYMCHILRLAGASKVLLCGDLAIEGALPDEQLGLGPLGGIASIARHGTDGVYIFVPVDMPLLTTTVIKDLVWALKAKSNTVNSASFVNHNLPLALNLNSFSRLAILQLVNYREARQRSIKHLINNLNGLALPLALAQENALINCNTQDDLQKAKVIRGLI